MKKKKYNGHNKVICEIDRGGEGNLDKNRMKPGHN